MENFHSLQRLKSYYTDVWTPGRQTLISKLSRIKEDIQNQAQMYSAGCISYVTIGILSGTFAIAAVMADSCELEVMALVLRMMGTVAGILSGAASLFHGIVKIVVIKVKCHFAHSLIEKHEETCEKMKYFLNILKEEIAIFKSEIRTHYGFETSQLKEEVTRAGGVVTLGMKIDDLVTTSKAADAYRKTGSSDEIVKIFSIGETLDELLPSSVKDVSNGSVKVSTIVLSTLTVIGMIVDIVSLVWNILKLTRMEKGLLCPEAEKLDNVIRVLQKEYDLMKKCFD